MPFMLLKHSSTSFSLSTPIIPSWLKTNNGLPDEKFEFPSDLLNNLFSSVMGLVDFLPFYRDTNFIYYRYKLCILLRIYWSVMKTK